MSDDDTQSCPPDPTRRKFLLTTGTSVAASLVAAYVPALANSTAGETDSAAAGLGPTIEGAVPITLRINGKDHQLRIDPRTTLLDCIRETCCAHRNKKRLRPRPVRRMHGACERPARDLMLEPRAAARRQRDHHDRGPGHTRRNAPHASGICCMRRLSMRLLHVGPNHVGGRAAQRTLRSRRCVSEGTDERQHLPLRRVRQHRGRHSTSSQERLAANRRFTMHTFEFIRPADRRGGHRGSRESEDGAARRGRALYRRRHDAGRLDEAER